jgi:hypothetical protein
LIFFHFTLFFLSYFLFKNISDLRSCISFRSFLWLPSRFLFYSKVLQKVSIPCLCPKLVMCLSSLECPLSFGIIFFLVYGIASFSPSKIRIFILRCNNTTYIHQKKIHLGKLEYLFCSCNTVYICVCVCGISGDYVHCNLIKIHFLFINDIEIFQLGNLQIVVKRCTQFYFFSLSHKL